MKNEVQKSHLQPSSFLDEFAIMTRGQSTLLKLLHHKIKRNEPISTDDIKECYYNAVNRNGYLNWYDYSNGNRQRKMTLEEFKQHFYSRDKSLQWFKANLGACILKGKLLVIPIIEIENEKLITSKP